MPLGIGIRENFQALGLPGDMALGRDGEEELLQGAGGFLLG